jgi:hypothetical protein
MVMSDTFCLILDPKSHSCAKNFSFFTFEETIGTTDDTFFTVLGLAPANELVGPSFVQALN